MRPLWNSGVLRKEPESRPPWPIIGIVAFAIAGVWAVPSLASDDHFESKIRPLLIERCLKCHDAKESKGGLRLDSRDGFLKGGQSGPAINLEKPRESLLIQAILHLNGLEMPPDGRLQARQIEDLAKWIEIGMPWPGAAISPGPPPSAKTHITPMAPNASALNAHLQLWLRADALELEPQSPVFIWPDSSGRGHDVSATKGTRAGGTGLPGTFQRHSTIMGRPAVHFDDNTGLAGSPDHRLSLNGDAALTVMIVMNLEKPTSSPKHATVFGIGDPAYPQDPGHPMAGLIEIDEPNQHSIDFAGGWGHDATFENSSFLPHYGRPVALTITKQPGSIRDTTRFYLNGQPIGLAAGANNLGDVAIPNIQHRTDIGVFLGKAVGFCGSIAGDIGEVIVFDRVLTDSERNQVEAYVADKYGLMLKTPVQDIASRAYTDSERSHWAYQPLRPSIDANNEARPPDNRSGRMVDALVAASLSSSGVPFPAAIDRTRWLRRVTLDLTGLPPTYEETSAFENDRSETAFQTVADRLLNSPRYGEHMARQWLDAVRFAETTANDANAVMRYAWRYRNYVIDAFNNDLPYDRFLVEQIAGDLIPVADSTAETARRIIATGFLMVGPKALAETDKEQSRLDIVDDQIDVIGRSMLGLTLACARCHDHKFDAIRAADYYAIAGILRSTEPFQDENRNATMWWEYPVLGPDEQPLTVMAPKESIPRNLRVHLRGNRFTLGSLVPRDVLGILSSPDHVRDGQLQPVHIDPHQTSSGRLELAQWIASPANPLTSRVLVNRIWQHHFGKGIVGTSDNFGTRGERPAAPELLDALAAHLIAQGWSTKAIHREIVLSKAYQMQNIQTLAATQDTKQTVSWPNWLRNRRRLRAEELRDAILATSGQLDTAPGTSESGEFLFEKAEDIKAKIRPNRVASDDPFYTTFRKRSIYLPIVRNMLPDVLALFDAADPNGVTTLRNETTVPGQGLFLLNHPFVVEQSKCFALRILSDTPTDSIVDRIQTAHRIALARNATEQELVDGETFIARIQNLSVKENASSQDATLVAWQSYCQTLLCSNEFLYVE